MSWVNTTLLCAIRCAVALIVVAHSQHRYAKEAKQKYEQEKNKVRENERQLALVQRQVQLQDDELSSHLADFSNLRLQMKRISRDFEVQALATFTRLALLLSLILQLRREDSNELICYSSCHVRRI
jgi:molecular chaperone GrpE (heat shock protein)